LTAPGTGCVALLHFEVEPSACALVLRAIPSRRTRAALCLVLCVVLGAVPTISNSRASGLGAYALGSCHQSPLEIPLSVTPEQYAEVGAAVTDEAPASTTGQPYTLGVLAVEFGEAHVHATRGAYLHQSSVSPDMRAQSALSNSFSSVSVRRRAAYASSTSHTASNNLRIMPPYGPVRYE